MKQGSGVRLKLLRFNFLLSIVATTNSSNKKHIFQGKCFCYFLWTKTQSSGKLTIQMSLLVATALILILRWTTIWPVKSWNQEHWMIVLFCKYWNCLCVLPKHFAVHERNRCKMCVNALRKSVKYYPSNLWTIFLL